MNELLNDTRPTVMINGIKHVVNTKEYEAFVQECQAFMDVEGNGFEVMTQIIADQLLECADPKCTIEEIRPQMKFLRELGFLLKVLTTPAGED